MGTLLTSLVTCYNIGGDSFNHNTVLLPFQAAALLLFYLATRLGGRWLGVSTGLIAGLSVLVKYVALAPLAPLAGMVLYFVLDRSLHQRAMLRGALLGACTFVLVLLPYLWWLVSVDFLPLRYAQFVTQKLRETLAPLPNVADFAFRQLQRLAPFLAALGVLLVVLRRAQQRMDAEAAKPTGPQPASVSDRDRLFIWIAALSPLFIVLAVGLFGGTALAARWGTNAFLLIGHVALLWLALPRAPVPGRLLWHAALWIVLPLQLLLCAGQTIGKTIGAEWLAILTWPNFPGAALAQMAQDTWRQHAGPRGAPLRLIAADSWLGGNLMLHAQGQPLQVLIDGSARQSPWVASDAVANCGALVLKDISGNRHTPTWPQPALDALLARAETSGVWTLPWLGTQRRAPVGPRALVRWGIISAADADVRCRIGEGSRKDREPPAAG